MIRTVEGAIRRIEHLAATDPSPDARAAYENVLDLLARIDTGTAADLIEATAPKPLPCFPRDWPVIPADMDEAEKRELIGSLTPEPEAEAS